MWFECSERDRWVPTSVTGVSRSLPSQSIRSPLSWGSVDTSRKSRVGKGSFWVEWHRAQLSAKTTLPLFSAATALWPAFGRGVSHVLVHHADRTDFLKLENGSLANVRRFRAGAIDADLIAGALQDSRANGTPPRVGSLGNSEPRTALASAR